MAFNEKDTLETPVLSFDFTNELIGETITLVPAPTVIVTTVSGTDANPGAILNGVVGVQQGVVLQGVQGGIAGVTYELKAIIRTSGNRTLVRYGYLPVVNV